MEMKDLENDSLKTTRAQYPSELFHRLCSLGAFLSVQKALVSTVSSDPAGLAVHLTDAQTEAWEH